MAQNKNKTASLSLSNGELCYEYAGKVVWSIRVTELRLLGEWTTDHGPHCDDYFFAFISGRPALWHEASVDANPQIMEQLEKEMGQPLRLGLVASTTFKSRVVWPPELQGHDLFNYTPQPRPAGLLNRFKDAILPLIYSELTQEVLECLNDNPASITAPANEQRP
jgi:hypothetical protein